MLKIKELFYICHYCVDYKTSNRKDMVKHFNRKNICKCNNPINSYEDSKELTLSKKFYFHFDISNLIRSDYLFIINHYNNFENHIYTDYMNSLKTKEISENNKDNIENNLVDNHNLLNEIITNSLQKILYNNEKSSLLIQTNKNLINTDDTYDDELSNDEEEDINESKNNQNHLYQEFKKMYYNEEKERYICDRCLAEYKSKQSLENHLLNIKKCDSNIRIKNAMNRSKQTSELILHKKEELKKEEEKHILNQNNVQNINQNIQNNINNINNSNQNNFSVALKDFVNDRYDISHISDSFYEKKDFFLYPNFLNMIMENEKNQNIFFSNNEAIIYTDNELNKMSSDKASYLILDKLSQSFDELLYKQDDEAREYYKFITKYYHVIKGHYKHDTISKEYNVDKREFEYTANSRLFRSRDKYSNKIIGTINKFNGNIRKNMNISIQDIKDIPIMNPNIEDFASVKMRYRDLKNKD